jgi:nicotinate-nucleotide adenylyltransferase
LSVLSEQYPSADFFTIIGDDAAAGLRTWTRWEEVVERSQVVVVDRPGESVDVDGGIEWIRVEVPRLEVSSTDLRARFTDGRPLDYLVTQPVLDVIRARGLFGVAR